MTDTLINGISFDGRKYAITFAGQSAYDLRLRIEDIKNRMNILKGSNNFTEILDLENELNELEIQNGTMASAVALNAFEMVGQGKKINIHRHFERFKIIFEKGIKEKDFENSEEYQNFLEYLKNNDEFKDLTVSFGDNLIPLGDFFKENFQQMCKFFNFMYGKKLPETDRIRTLSNFITIQTLLPEEEANLQCFITNKIEEMNSNEEYDDSVAKQAEENDKAVEDNKKITENNTKDIVISGIQIGAVALAVAFPPSIVISIIIEYFKNNNNTPIAEFFNKKINNFKNNILAPIEEEIKGIKNKIEKAKTEKEKKKLKEDLEAKKKQRDEIKDNMEELDANGNLSWIKGITKEDTEDISKLKRIVYPKMNYFPTKSLKTIESHINANKPARTI